MTTQPLTTYQEHLHHSLDQYDCVIRVAYQLSDPSICDDIGGMSTNEAFCKAIINNDINACNNLTNSIESDCKVYACRAIILNNSLECNNIPDTGIWRDDCYNYYFLIRNDDQLKDIKEI